MYLVQQMNVATIFTDILILLYCLHSKQYKNTINKLPVNHKLACGNIQYASLYIVKYAVKAKKKSEEIITD